MQFRLRTLLIVLALGPLVLAATWWAVGRDILMLYQGVDLRGVSVVHDVRGPDYSSSWDLPYPRELPGAGTNGLE